ncbi:hypothetical protein QBC42DRAFT_324825 [Cladorrhinum samala]|uniref:Amidohydrolase 3 domain-containing protein n=1 Tax=Cladorrhinum samala TaxID=585594 RepID=A0AAV9H6J5_9PEZI|nr:hypothetical protein QBC42DRAFT_324825 [Cladorrhinum samala]
MRLSYTTPAWGGILAFLWSVRVLGNPDAGAAPDTNGTVLISSVLNSNSIPASQMESDGTLRGSLILHNGRIHTLSGGSSPSVVSVLAIRSGQIVYVGDSLPSANRLFQSDPSPPRIVNLRQRTAVPGLIDAHNHIVVLGNRPGYHTPLEYSLSISDVQNAIRQRTQKARVPEGKWITTVGGFSPNQFSEQRLPTLAELDAAAPDHPVFISTGFAGPAATNSKGRAVLGALSWEHGPVNVSSTGAISIGTENGKALLYLRSQLTFDDRTRGVRDAMAYAASVGVTTHLDQGAFQSSNTPFDLSGSEDLYTFHKPWLSVYSSSFPSGAPTAGGGTADKSQSQQQSSSSPALIRLRINFLHSDNSTSTPTLTQRLLNAFPFFGNSMVRTGAIGEFHVAIDSYAGNNPVFDEAALKIARAGWRLEVHSLTDADFKGQIQSFERVSAQSDITKLRWVVAHVPSIDHEYLGRLNALGGGVNLSGWLYLEGRGNASSPAGPPWKTIVESGIPAGFGADGANIAPLSPWPHVYYAATGKNAKGELINPGQTISRQKILEMYTRDNTWFLGGPDERSLGILEEGRLGDVAVLSDDYFTVPDEKLKSLRSVLTVVGGVVVHDSGEL